MKYIKIVVLCSVKDKDFFVKIEHIFFFHHAAMDTDYVILSKLMATNLQNFSQCIRDNHLSSKDYFLNRHYFDEM